MPDQNLTLEELGWSNALEKSFENCREQDLIPGRVAVEDKHYYLVITPDGPLTGQVSGKLLHNTRSPAGLPKVGDWVALSPMPSENKAVIHQVLPRQTTLSRKSAGRETEEQVLATNIDIVFVVQALDNSFNPARMQRHLVMAFESGAKPMIILNKADLCAELPAKIVQAQQAAGECPLVVVSAKTGQGINDLAQLVHKGETVVFIGGSGVGKSSLINDLCGEEIQATAEVRERDAKGRHTTTWRELIQLPNGGLVIDTPGMREFHMWMADDGLREAFSDLEALATQCRFRDCTHTVEKHCAVLEALNRGEISAERYSRFSKLKKELAYLEEAHTKHGWAQRRRRSRVAQRALSKPKRP